MNDDEHIAAGHIRVIGEDKMCFWVHPVSLEPVSPSVFDPWCDKPPFPPRRLSVSSWDNQRLEKPNKEATLVEVAKDSRGNRLYRVPNAAGGNTYWSDEIGGGVIVWDTALVSAEMVRLALAEEERIETATKAMDQIARHERELGLDY